eukprot:sb/3469717/
MGTGIFKVIRKYHQTSTGSSKSSSRSLRYRLTNDYFDDVHLQLIIETSAPIGCASSKGFLIIHPASPGGFFRPFQRQKHGCHGNSIDNYGDWHFKTHPLGAPQSFENINKLPLEVPKVSSLSLRYRLTNDFDVHLQLIIEIHGYLVTKSPYYPFAPIGCASSKGLLITHPASPCGSFRHFQHWHVKSHSKILTNFHWKFQKCEQELYNFVPIECFMKEQSVA